MWSRCRAAAEAVATNVLSRMDAPAIRPSEQTFTCVESPGILVPEPAVHVAGVRSFKIASRSDYAPMPKYGGQLSPAPARLRPFLCQCAPPMHSSRFPNLSVAPCARWRGGVTGAMALRLPIASGAYRGFRRSAVASATLIFLWTPMPALKVSNLLAWLSFCLRTDSHLAAVFGRSDFTLECLPHLRKCRLVFKLRELCVAGNNSLVWITTLLGQLASPDLQEILLLIEAHNTEDLRAWDSECGVREVHPVDFDDLRALNWEGLECSATQGRLPSLSKVTIEGRGHPDSFLAWARSLYPTLATMFCLRPST